MDKTLSIETLDVQQINLKDSAGRTRCQMKCGDGYPYFILNDHDEQMRLSLSVDMDGLPNVTLFTAAGKPSLIITTGKAGEPSIWLYDEEHKDPRIGILVDNRSGAYVELWNPSSDGGIVLVAHADGTSQIKVQLHEDIRPSVHCTLKPNGEAELEVSCDGQVCWSVTTETGSENAKRSDVKFEPET